MSAPCPRCEGIGTVRVKVYDAHGKHLEPAICGHCGGAGTIRERTK